MTEKYRFSSGKKRAFFLQKSKKKVDFRLKIGAFLINCVKWWIRVVVSENL